MKNKSRNSQPRTFKVPTWLHEKIENAFPEEYQAIKIEIDNQPDKVGDILYNLSKKKFTPWEIEKAFEEGKEDLLKVNAKAWAEKWRVYMQFNRLYNKYHGINA